MREYVWLRNNNQSIILGLVDNGVARCDLMLLLLLARQRTAAHVSIVRINRETNKSNNDRYRNGKEKSNLLLTQWFKYDYFALLQEVELTLVSLPFHSYV